HLSGARADAPRAPRRLRAIAAGAVSWGAVLLLATPAWCAWQTFGLADGLAALHLTAIAQDLDENLWFTSGSGVSRYDGAFFKSFGQTDGLASDDVRAVLPDHLGRIWFGTAQGVSRFDHGTWSTLTTNDGLVSNDVTAIVEDHVGRLWFAT